MIRGMEDAPAAQGGTQFQLRRVVGRAGGTVPGPTLILTGGLHGNEPGGIVAQERVFARLERERIAVRGEVLGLAGNLAALAAGRRYLAADLNRLWTRESIERVRSGGAESPEDRELDELHAMIDGAIARRKGPVALLDLHTASSPTPAFVILGDTLRNRRFAGRFPAPIVLGLEEQLVGTLMEYVTGRGHVSIAVEGGQHEDVRAAKRLEAVVWLALVASGCVAEEDVPQRERYRDRVRASKRGLPRFLEILHRHSVEPEDGFVMRPGYRNFQPVGRGEHLASDREGPILSPGSHLLFLPLYQGLGSDGFFLARPVNAFWLKLSTFLRWIGLPSVAPLLPGVRPHAELASTLVVDPRVARFLAPEVFHLLGFRVRAGDVGWVVTRRRER